MVALADQQKAETMLCEVRPSKWDPRTQQVRTPSHHQIGLDGRCVHCDRSTRRILHHWGW